MSGKQNIKDWWVLIGFFVTLFGLATLIIIIAKSLDYLVKTML